MRRLLPPRRELPVLAWMALVYLGLLGTVSVASALSAVVVAVVLRAAMPLPRLPGGARVRPLGVLRLVGRMLVDLVRSSTQVAWLAVRPGPPPPTAIVAAQLRTRADLLVVTTSQLLSLVPGSVLVDLDTPSATIYLHMLGITDDGTATRRRVADVERLVAGALGTDAERDACTAPPLAPRSAERRAAR